MTGKTVSDPVVFEEKEILDAFDDHRLKRVKSADDQIAAHREIAEATFKKDARINIRLSSRDLRALQARALKEGIMSTGAGGRPEEG